jgi:hypothetical protein
MFTYDDIDEQQHFLAAYYCNRQVFIKIDAAAAACSNVAYGC